MRTPTPTEHDPLKPKAFKEPGQRPYTPPKPKAESPVVRQNRKALTQRLGIIPRKV